MLDKMYVVSEWSIMGLSFFLFFSLPTSPLPDFYYDYEPHQTKTCSVVLPFMRHGWLNPTHLYVSLERTGQKRKGWSGCLSSRRMILLLLLRSSYFWQTVSCNLLVIISFSCVRF